MKGKSIYFLYIFFTIFFGLIFLIHLGGSNSWALPVDAPLNVFECFPSRSASDPNASNDVSSLETIIIVFTHEMDFTDTQAAFHFYREDEGIDLGGSFNLDGSELTFTPSPPLQKGIVYVVRIDSTAKSADEPFKYLTDDWKMKIVINGTVGYSQTYDTDDGLSADIISSMAVDGQNRLWVGTSSESQDASICYFDGDIWRENTPSVDSFHIEDVACMVVDNEGDLWAGLNIEDPQDDPNTPMLAKLENNTWHVISAKDLNNIDPGGIKDMAVDSENKVWIITDTTGVLRYNYITGEVILYPAPEGSPPKEFMKSLMIDNDDNVWIGTVNLGIWKVDAQSHSWDNQYALLYDFPSGVVTINTMVADPYGNIWVGTDDGLLKLDLSGLAPNWTEYKIETGDGLPGDIINVLGIDPNNDLVWVGTSGGLGEFNITNEEGTAYIEGLKSDISDKVINALDVNPRGEVWFGTDYGLQMLDEISPYITNKYCSGTQLVFYVKDGMRVDPNSIEVKIDGEDVTGDVNKTKESNNSYEITYNNAFPEDEEITVTVAAEDLIGNQLIDYQFLITPQENPYITNKSCSLTQLVFYVIDDGVVVDPNSIKVQVDNIDVTESENIQIIEGDNNSYQVIYSPDNLFPEDEAITVIVNVDF